MSEGRKYPGENFVDGALLQKAADRHRPAIQEICGLAAVHLSALATHHIAVHDDLTPYVISALKQISSGLSPNEAFRWGQAHGGNPGGGTGLRDLQVRLLVQQRMKQRGETKTVACEMVADDYGAEFGLGEDKIKTLCTGLTKETELEMDDLYPLPKPQTQHVLGECQGSQLRSSWPLI